MGTKCVAVVGLVLFLGACGEDGGDGAGADTGQAQDSWELAQDSGPELPDLPPPDPPEIDRVEPSSGLLSGHEQVSVFGRRFDAPCHVWFGDQEGESTSVVDPNRLLSTITPPMGREGTLDVRVSCRNGDATLDGGFTYLSATSAFVESIEPTLGSTAGGDVVSLHGRNFAVADRMLIAFDGHPAGEVTVWDAETLTCVTPASAAGPATVTLELGDDIQILPDAFRYVEPVVLVAIEPELGALEGGTEVVLEGSGFAEDVELAVRFGEADADPESFELSEDGRTLSLVTPPGEGVGVVDVVASGLIGESRLEAAYTYVRPVLVSEVRPRGVPSAGGQRVTLEGEGFDGAAEPLGATVGGQDVADLVVESETLLSFIAPPLDPGVYDVLLEHGLQTVRVVDGLTVYAPIAVSSAEPASGPESGGTRVTVRGSGFVDGAIVLFGTEAALDVAVGGDGQTIGVTTPAGTGIVGVTVSTPFTRATLMDGFSYLP